MRPYAPAAAALCLTLCASLGACATSPKETVLNLDTTDRRWSSRGCVAARKAVARYDDGGRPRLLVGFVGDLIAPFAGTAVATAMSAAKDPEREKLNTRVRRACVSESPPPRRRRAG
jgi:hypothetical protein